jgi:hypothetical protein
VRVKCLGQSADFRVKSFYLAIQLLSFFVVYLHWFSFAWSTVDWLFLVLVSFVIKFGNLIDSNLHCSWNIEVVLEKLLIDKCCIILEVLLIQSSRNLSEMCR